MPSAKPDMPEVYLRYILLAALLLPLAVLAQPANNECSTAGTLCSNGQLLAADNTGASNGFNFCANNQSAIWYSFTTNSLGGDATISITGIDCPAIPGMDNELQAVVLSGNQNCDPASFAMQSTCEIDSMDFWVDVNGLLPETEYWVMISGVNDGPNTSVPAQCGFDIGLSGPGVQIVGVDFYASDDEEISPGGSVQLLATGGTTYDWSPTTGLSGNGIPDPFSEPNGTTQYLVTTQLNGCAYTDTVIVFVEQQITAPNTFTPNGDNINDFWLIERIEEFPRAEVLVYDRWGQTVFKSTGYSTAWDGTNKGRKLPTATYYYYIKLNQLEGAEAPITGSITIVR